MSRLGGGVRTPLDWRNQPGRPGHPLTSRAFPRRNGLVSREPRRPKGGLPPLLEVHSTGSTPDGEPKTAPARPRRGSVPGTTTGLKKCRVAIQASRLGRARPRAPDCLTIVSEDDASLAGDPRPRGEE